MTTSKHRAGVPAGVAAAPEDIQGEEIRVILPIAIVRHMKVYRALLGQSSQAFIQAAVLRHLEAIGQLKLEFGPGGGQGVGVVASGQAGQLPGAGAPAGESPGASK